MPTYEIVVPAPTIKPVRKRKTGKLFTRKPWLNSNDRDHWRVTNPIKKAWRENAYKAAAEAGLPMGLEYVRVDYYINKTRNGSYDAGNYYPTIKPIVDGLVDYGLVDDDSNDYLEGPYPHPGEKGDASIRVVITEAEPQTDALCTACDGTGQYFNWEGVGPYECPTCKGGNSK